ncbi:histidine phosphatase family protein [Ruegeria sp. HKCCD4884]|uniref:SixA phosphatase family protein n=1 Tax=Ruegeria sp. HKCCD4884 TaxID=2683022 RepID=UPI001492B96F|nr:histidine phosphatase family protein [Ruegeria sp. HKCCD4884]NOD95463.1 histidine phosphatase family protein [Ruegeria sp. HKCCD4884]
MTRTLILTRHAKSSWENPMLDDHARPLNKRGRKSAPAIAKWLRVHGWAPDEVLSSTSARTRETWDRMGMTAEHVRFQDALYLASPDQMLRQLFDAKGQTVLMLGHNPGIAQFAQQLVQDAPKHPRFLDYPTCATTVIEFDVDSWAELQRHSGTVLGFVIPRELPE